MSDELLEEVSPSAKAGAAKAPAKSPSKASVKPSASAAKAGAPHLALRIALGTAGLLLVVGFFLPWVQLAEDTQIGGLQLVFDNNRDIRAAIGETQRWILLVIPALGVALTAIGFLGLRWAGTIGAIVGFLLLGYGIVTVVTIFIQTTAVGLWLIVGGAFLALGAGIVAMLKARAKPAKSVPLADDAPV